MPDVLPNQSDKIDTMINYFDIKDTSVTQAFAQTEVDDARLMHAADVLSVSFHCSVDKKRVFNWAQARFPDGLDLWRQSPYFKEHKELLMPFINNGVTPNPGLYDVPVVRTADGGPMLIRSHTIDQRITTLMFCKCNNSVATTLKSLTEEFVNSASMNPKAVHGLQGVAFLYGKDEKMGPLNLAHSHSNVLVYAQWANESALRAHDDSPAWNNFLSQFKRHLIHPDDLFEYKQYTILVTMEDYIKNLKK